MPDDEDVDRAADDDGSINRRRWLFTRWLLSHNGA